jgi:hypothetical protein
MREEIDLERKGQDKDVFSVTCVCGHTYRVFTEHRRAHRRNIQLPGTYQLIGREEEQGIASIHNLSMSGVGFHTSSTHGLGKGAELLLRFKLANGVSEEIEAAVVVRHVQNTYLGCEFYHLEPQAEERLAGLLASIP